MSEHHDEKTPVGTRDASGPPATQVKRTERPHPLTPLIHGWVALVVLVVAGIRQAIPEGGGKSNLQVLFELGVQWLVLGVLAIIVLAAGIGFVSWYFTRFVIDDEELRIETGALAKKSRRIAFKRVQSVDVIQPLRARIFGLVELRIEVGGGDGQSKLRYLTRRQATHIRDFLLARAHGDQLSFEAAGQMPESSVLTDLSSTERPLVKIGPSRLLFGFLLSSPVVITVAIAAAVIAISLIFRQPVIGLATIIPWAFTAFNLVSRHLLAQFNYTLTESARGLRISRGLTNLTTQSLPIDRIQGVRIDQSLLWRPAGWWRVDVDVLGYGSSSERGESNTDVSSILLPVATWDQVQTTLARILPETDLNDPPLRPAPKRARIIRPLDGWRLRYGWDDRVIITRHGVLIDSSEIVPHAKAQSVRTTRGPLQRRLRLASVHVDTPDGPVHWAAKHLDPQAARELALTELDRARSSRRAEQASGPSPKSQNDESAILTRFGIPGTEPLGAGGESRVYPLDQHRVLRVYHAGHEAAPELVDQLQRAYQAFSWHPIGLQLPQILESGRAADRFYSIDRRFTGAPLARRLASSPQDQRRQLLLDYLHAATRLSQLPLPEPRFARLFGTDARSFDSLADLIGDQLGRARQLLASRMGAALVDRAVDRLIDQLRDRRCWPTLVHGDYGPGNVFATEIEHTVRVTGVADFSPHTLAADPVMDVAGAITLLELEPYDGAGADSCWLREQATTMLAAEIAPDELAHWLDVYRRYYAIYFSDDERVYPWAVSVLRSEEA